MSRWIAVILATIVVAAFWSLPTAATFRPQGGHPASQDGVLPARTYLERQALIYSIRARFSVVAFDGRIDLLRADARSIGADGPTPQEMEAVNRQLLAEASYYIVSLRYLAESGGAIWPEERLEKEYRDAALATLGTLQAVLFDVVERAGDPLPILIEVDRINAWTEGFAETPSSLDHFWDRDEMVDAALKALPAAPNL